MTKVIDNWYLENLVCPVDGSSLELRDSFLISEFGRRYPIIDGIPVMLRPDTEVTIGVARASLEIANRVASGISVNQDEFYLATVGISEAQREQAKEMIRNGDGFNAIVSVVVAATSGHAYQHLLGRENSYFLPEFRFPDRQAGNVLDIGCNWGRWSLASAKLGFQPVGIDPQLGSVLAARWLANKLGLSARFVVGDARFLPFRENSFENVWSYSVLQHFSIKDARLSLREVRRVLRPEGVSRIQMASQFGLRSFYHLLRRAFREPKGFEVRYWRPDQMKAIFQSDIGKTKLSTDCFFGLGLQWSDYHVMSLKGKSVLLASEFMTRLSSHVPWLGSLADSRFCTSVKSERSKLPLVQ
jgi:SAM-dependent methyltransferase/uncharacterized protein YbaR (Trm112 family)